MELVTVGMTEVAPGDTISGSTQCRLISESATKPVMNRTYLDLFSFYVPFRLVWDDWPEFIAGDDTKTIPLIAGTPNGRQYLTKMPDTALAQQQNAFGRRAYNLINNKFFRDPSLPEDDLDQPGTLTAPLRTTTLQQRLRSSAELTDQTIDTSGPTISTQDIRTAFSQDRFNKTRAYYGNKYTDYLAALGVEASWSILDEPELIGRSTQTLKFVLTDATTEIDSVEPDNTPSYVGSVGGKWQGTNKHSIRRTFAPEHGYIMTLATVRQDVNYGNSVGLICNNKTTRDQFYSPEFETERKQAWQAFTTVDQTGTQELVTEKFDDYRVGDNWYAFATNTAFQNPTWLEAAAADNLNPDLIRYPDAQTANDEFLNNQYANITFNLMCTHRLSRVSPIRPAQSVHGVA